MYFDRELESIKHSESHSQSVISICTTSQSQCSASHYKWTSKVSYHIAIDDIPPEHLPQDTPARPHVHSIRVEAVRTEHQLWRAEPPCDHVFCHRFCSAFKIEHYQLTVEREIYRNRYEDKDRTHGSVCPMQTRIRINTPRRQQVQSDIGKAILHSLTIYFLVRVLAVACGSLSCQSEVSYSETTVLRHEKISCYIDRSHLIQCAG